MTAPLHVIVGAGQIGPMVAARLLARGHRVRMVRRGKFTGVPAGVETESADVSVPGQAIAALRGASVVYHCANPRYHRWPQELAPLARGILAGAKAAGARLVVLDNLYLYEVPAEGGMSEDTRVAPVSKKGVLRAAVAEELLDAHRRGDVPVAIGRASDFIGPGAPLAASFGERFWKRLFAGKAVEVLGNPALPHSYSYTPDVAEGLCTLGTRDEAMGRVWHLPVLPAEPTQMWLERLAAAAGVPLRQKALGPMTLRFVGLFLPEAGEVVEMLYQFNRRFALDDLRFRATFGAVPTPVDEVVAATVGWARSVYAPAQPAGARLRSSAQP